MRERVSYMLLNACHTGRIQAEIRRDVPGGYSAWWGALRLGDLSQREGGGGSGSRGRDSAEGGEAEQGEDQDAFTVIGEHGESSHCRVSGCMERCSSTGVPEGGRRGKSRRGAAWAGVVV